MTRYGVCLILERGEVSLPEGLVQGTSPRWYILFFLLLVRVEAGLHTLLCLLATQGFSGTSRSQTAQESAVMDGFVRPRGWRGRRGSQR